MGRNVDRLSKYDGPAGREDETRTRLENRESKKRPWRPHKAPDWLMAKVTWGTTDIEFAAARSAAGTEPIVVAALSSESPIFGFKENQEAAYGQWRLRQVHPEDYELFLDALKIRIRAGRRSFLEAVPV